jgi:hypothetical protein
MTSLRAKLVSAARGALNRGDLAGTQRHATVLVANDAKDAEGHFLLGIAEAGSGRIRLALPHLQHAVALDAQGEYRAQLARLLIMLRQDGEAAAILQAAEATPPPMRSAGTRWAASMPAWAIMPPLCPISSRRSGWSRATANISTIML